MADVTMGAFNNPAKRLKRLKEQHAHLKSHVAELEDKIGIIEHEMRECENA